jgi:hypothetical protein
MVFALTGMLSSMIPDVPTDVQVQINRERTLEKDALFDVERRRNKKRPSSYGGSISSSDYHSARNSARAAAAAVEKNDTGANSRRSSARMRAKSPAFLVEEVSTVTT